MKQMKTLTLPNGVTYEIVDEEARRMASDISATPSDEQVQSAVDAWLTANFASAEEVLF